MKHPANSEPIDVDALRIGMFIHLDAGWLSHPFPLSSFKIGSQAQIETLRSLALKVRWCVDQSDPAPPAETAAPDADSAPAAEALQQPAAGPDDLTHLSHREALAREREAQALCERHFSEAAKACKAMTESVSGKPQSAREQAETLTRALAEEMLGEGDLCIRLLNETAGDKAAAHAMNVTVISMLMGRSFGFNPADMLDLGLGAMLHDIGKLDLPERMRQRDEHFSASEARFYEEHVAHGVTHGRKMGLTSGALLVIAQHHECADGSGFPLKLNSDRMTLGARIVAVVNRYDKLCNPHIPSRAITPHEAVALLFAQGRDKFDSAILGAFIKMMGVYPPGSAVQLTNDRYAIVVGVNSSRPLKPRVLVHVRGVPREDALIVDLEQTPGLGIRRSIKPMALPPESLGYLAPKPRVAYFFESAREAMP
jgi:putative nucleotidyltransferase with HDIG domain